MVPLAFWQGIQIEGDGGNSITRSPLEEDFEGITIICIGQVTKGVDLLQVEPLKFQSIHLNQNGLNTLNFEQVRPI